MSVVTCLVCSPSGSSPARAAEQRRSGGARPSGGEFKEMFSAGCQSFHMPLVQSFRQPAQPGPPGSGAAAAPDPVAALLDTIAALPALSEEADEYQV